MGIASASAGRGYPTLPPSAEALHKHAGPGPSFVLFAERKSLQKAQRNTPSSGTLVNVPTMTPAPLQKLKYEIAVMIESLPYLISTCAFVWIQDFWVFYSLHVHASYHLETSLSSEGCDVYTMLFLRRVDLFHQHGIPWKYT